MIRGSWVAALCVSTFLAGAAKADSRLCISSENLNQLFYVTIGGHMFTFADRLAPCQTTPVWGPIKGGISQNDGDLKDCALSVPEGYAYTTVVSIYRHNPGIGGVQPMLRCDAWFDPR